MDWLLQDKEQQIVRFAEAQRELEDKVRQFEQKFVHMEEESSKLKTEKEQLVAKIQDLDAQVIEYQKQLLSFKDQHSQQSQKEEGNFSRLISPNYFYRRRERNYDSKQRIS